MRILVSAGDKTSKVALPLLKRFESGAVQIYQEDYIENIYEYFQRGDILDRIIISQLSLYGIEREFDSEDVHKKLQQLSDIIKTVVSDVKIIFIINNNDVNEVINSEMFEHRGNILVIKRLEAYTVSFFVDICTKDIKDLKIAYVSDSEDGLEDKQYSYTSEISIEHDKMIDYDRTQGSRIFTDDIDVRTGTNEYKIEELFSDSIYADDGNISQDGGESVENKDSKVGGAEDAEGEGSKVDGVEDVDSACIIENEINENDDIIDISDILYNDSEAEDTGIDRNIENVENVIKSLNSDEIDMKVTVRQIGGQTSIDDKVKAEGTRKRLFFNKRNKRSNNQINVSSENDKKDVTDNIGVLFEDSIYEGDDIGLLGRTHESSVQEIINSLALAGARHSSYIFTGARGCGVTTIAFNTAYIIAQLGFSVLYIDCDTVNKGSSFITLNNYNALHTSEDTRSSLLTAISNPSNIDNYINVLEPGFHILGMGIDYDKRPLEDIMKREKFQRFINLAKDDYNFVVYDLPFNTMLTVGEDAIYNSDKIAYVTESNTKGFMSLLNDMANINDEDVRTVLFTRLNVLLNRHSKETLYFAKKLNKISAVIREIDGVASEVTSGQSELMINDLNFICTIPFIMALNNMWLNKINYMKNREIHDIFLKVTRAIVDA